MTLRDGEKKRRASRRFSSNLSAQVRAGISVELYTQIIVLA